jgi:hypothetical protein
MNSTCFRSCALATALMFAFSSSMAEQPQTAATAGVALYPSTGEQSQMVAVSGVPADKPATNTFSQQDLDQLLAPVALYPDALLAQIFMASTYPLEVIEATRWVKANPKVTGKALEDAMEKTSWDPSVKSLTSVPQVLQQMNDKLDWMQKLGDAFLAQQKDVLATVQSLRAKAFAAGNLKSSTQQLVKTETQDGQTIYIIESAKEEVVYVPIYNPYVTYGTWWYPSYPPYYMYPPSYVYPPYVAFHAGIFVGVAIWGSVNWHHGGGVYVNVNHYNSFNRANINNGSWNHNVDHRRGVAYADQNVARQYNRGGDMQTAQARDNYRGRGDTGSANRPSTRDSTGTRDGSGGGYSGAGNGVSTRDSSGARDGSGGGFSGVGNGASTREASQRGSASRGSYGGGGGGYRGGGGGGRGGGGGGRGGGGRR